MIRRLFAFAVVVFAVGCSQGPKPSVIASAFTDTSKVRTIVLARSESELAACQAELERSGARILYTGGSGLLFVDKPREALTLEKCRSTVVENTPQTLHSQPIGRDALNRDLSTLLRLIPAEEIGARSFVQANPGYDGRGVVVAILDTGIELDHPMFQKTTDGKDKVVGFHDTSGQGRVELAPVTVDAEGNFTVAGTTYSLKGVAAAEPHFGVFPGSTLQYSEDVAEIDVFKDVGVVTYKTAEGQWRARVDVNADKSFSEEVEVFDYAQSRKIIRLGEKGTLSAGVNVSPDGKVTTLCFDDGSHGTHVAGIAAGYQAGGLQGVAPGAQVLAVKIGDNRLSGGSTTTASMLLAIDYAVAQGAGIINLSYGIRAGSNLGRSAIDQYVDKVAAEKGVLFAISAGNEGPGLQTIGTPAGANLAITNAAYVSRRTAVENYGYVGVEQDNTWFFSSVGPRSDGGWKPTLLAPGTAVASVPSWAGGTANYRGTSMASPQVTGGLALLVSAAKQAGLPSDRVSVTNAVYRSATPVAGLKWIEQGHGLMNVNKALEALRASKDRTPIEYTIAVQSPTAPGGKGAGVFVRSRRMPAELFTVSVTPVFPKATPAAEKSKLRTFRLSATAPWVRVPDTLWMNASAKTFQVDLDPAILSRPGVHSEKVTAVDEATGETAFEVPVTVVAPTALSDANGHRADIDTKVKVGETLRYFFEVPSGATAVTVDLESDGPMIWAQLLDPEGHSVLNLTDPERTAPQPPLFGSAKVVRPGVYELDVVAPPYNRRPAGVRLRVQALALQVALGTPSAPGVANVVLQNHFAPIKVVPKVEVKGTHQTRVVTIPGNGTEIPFTLTEDDVKRFQAIRFTVRTDRGIYDLMTDYPYRVFDKNGKLVLSGGLEPLSQFELPKLADLTPGDFRLQIQGAFTKEPPASWAIELTEERLFKAPVLVLEGKRLLLETGAQAEVPVDFNAGGNPSCVTVSLLQPGSQRVLQERLLCR